MLADLLAWEVPAIPFAEGRLFSRSTVDAADPKMREPLADERADSAKADNSDGGTGERGLPCRTEEQGLPGVGRKHRCRDRLRARVQVPETRADDSEPIKFRYGTASPDMAGHSVLREHKRAHRAAIGNVEKRGV